MKYLFFILFLILLAFNSLAQTLKDTIHIKEVNIISKKPLEQTGISVTRIDTLILKETANSSLSELLSENTPVFIKSAGQGSLATASFRGTSPSHTDVLWNGISINSPMLGQVDLSMIPVYLIDDISLLHGSSSIQNSSGALGGSISLNNKPDWNNKFSTKIIQGYGSFNTYNEYLQINCGNKTFQSKTRIFYIYSKNNFKFKNKNNADIDTVSGEYIYPIQKNTNAEFSHYGLLQEFYLRIKNNINASLKYWFQNSERSIPHLNTYEGNYYSNINKQFNNTNRIIADISGTKNKLKFGLTSALIIKEMTYFLKNYISGNDYENAVYSESNSKSSFNKAYLRFNANKKTIFNLNISTNFHNVETIDTVSHNGYNKTRLEYLTYVSCNRQISKRLSALFMLRKNFIDSVSVPFIPYLGFNYLIYKKNNVVLKFNIGENYRFPVLNEIYWQPGGNPDLLTENAKSGEFGISANSKIEKMSIENSVSCFYSDINNWIIWLPSVKGYWSPQNISHVISKGFEYSLKIKFDIGKFKIKANANYAYTSSLNYGNKEKWGTNSYGKQLPYIPVHSGNVLVNISLKTYSLSYIHNSYSERFTTSSNDFTHRDWLYPYYMNHLYLSKEFSFDKFDLNIQFKIYNLFNEEYRSVLFRPMPKQNYFLIIMLKF